MREVTSSRLYIDKWVKSIIPGSLEGRRSLVLSEGRGAVVRDVGGSEYIDCHAGYAVTNLGHCHPRAVRAVKEQVEKLWHVSWDFNTVPTALLAEKLAQITPPKLTKTIFLSVGAEAVENAVKLAKKYAVSNGRSGAKVISFMGAFHGRTSYAMALTGNEKYKRGLATFVHPGAVHVPPPYCYRCPYDKQYPDCGLYCAQKLEEVMKFGSNGDVAAMIAEPMLGEGGIVPLPDGYLKEAIKLLDAHDVLFIADEVQTGFGRTGKLFAVEWYGVEPEIMTLAKGIASGLPIAAVITTDEIGGLLTPVDHTSTYGGNPLMAAAALECVNVLLEENLPERALEKGNVLMDGLKELAQKHVLIGDVRGKGLMIGMELVRDRKIKAPAPEAAGKLREEAEKRGVLINVGGMFSNVIRLQPPLVIEDEQIERVLQVLNESLGAISR